MMSKINQNAQLARNIGVDGATPAPRDGDLDMDISSREKLLQSLAENPCDGPEECEAAQEPCYAGQWTVHSPHHYEVHRMAWRGGGTEMIHCPGKTKETVLA